VQAFYPPDDLLSKSQGSTQLLPNGNALVNWGSEGAVTEFRADGTPIFHAYMDSGDLGLGVENYRGFRYNWTGLPREAPSLVLLDSGHGDSKAHVSWNGDTETVLWRFFSVGHGEAGSRSFLGETRRTSFETELVIKDRKVNRVVAKAIGADGKVLTTTGVALSEADVEQGRSLWNSVLREQSQVFRS
jgi:hypothetical protein